MSLKMSTEVSEKAANMSGESSSEAGRNISQDHF